MSRAIRTNRTLHCDKSRPLAVNSMRVPLLILLAALFLIACRKPDDMHEGDYHVANHLATGLKVYAEFRGQPVALLRDTVPPGDTVHIHHVKEGSGGHVYPSNFFSVFRITTVDSTGSVVLVYQGLDHRPWQQWDNGVRSKAMLLLLVVD